MGCAPSVVAKGGSPAGKASASLPVSGPPATALEQSEHPVAVTEHIVPEEEQLNMPLLVSQTPGSPSLKPAPIRKHVDDDIAEIDRLLLCSKSELEKGALLMPAAVQSFTTHDTGSSALPKSSSYSSMKSAAGVEVQQVQLFTQPPSTPPLPRMPAPPPLPALQAPAAASASAAQEDPWASLQSAYRIDDTPRVSPSRPGLQDPLPGLRGGLGSTPGGRTPSRAVGLAGCRQGSASKPTAADALLLNDDDDDLMQHQPLYGGQRVQARRAGAPPSNGAKQGGWGKGEMAQAGTLMVGDAELLPLGPAAAAGVQQGSSHDFVRGMTSNELTDADMDEVMGTSQQPTSKPVTCNEVMDMEDIDDVDSLIESEAVRAGLNPELAAKLAAFEAVADDD